MAKRKRVPETVVPLSASKEDAPSKITKSNGHLDVKTPGPTIQVVAGSYERVLHGITVSLSSLASSNPSIQFANTFLFNAHASAIRCVALSPLPNASSADTGGVYLATGGSDERINVYSLSASPLPENDKLPAMPTLANNKISENPHNRELGTLMQHSSNVTSLHFPTRSKLLSASEDNTIAISRTRDLTVVSTIKAPKPKVQGQPSGDTAPPGATPAGINDFAVHPSMKLMISVGRGERAMRLWNLLTVKKASVLNFDRDILQAVKESKYSSGEGRKIRWSRTGAEFAVSFERGVVCFGEDAMAKCVALPQPLTKIHQIAYTNVAERSILIISTEDSRIIFYDTASTNKAEGSTIANAKVLAQIGGRTIQMGTRVKDFKVLQIKSTEANVNANSDELVIVSGTSDGQIRLWHLDATALATISSSFSTINKKATNATSTPQIGKLLGTYDTGSRITCLDAFVMLPPVDDVDGGLSEFEGFTEVEDESSSESSDDE